MPHRDILVRAMQTVEVRGLPAWLDLPEPRGFQPKRKYRTIWISDVHLVD